MKTRTKGNRNQRKAITELEEKGYLVSKVELGGKFTTQKDLFGLFDLVAIAPNGKVYFIQITTNRPHTHKDYVAFVKRYKPSAVIEQWVWFDRKGWKKFLYLKDKYKVVDERK